MVNTDKVRKIIVVAGDVTMDWNIARREDYQGSGLVWNAEDYIRTYSKPGGAALLADLISTMAQQLNREESPAPFSVRGIEPQKSVSPDDEQYHHSYAIWSLYKYDESSPEHKDVRVWRVKNYLGLHPSENIKNAMAERWKSVEADIPQSILVVFDDANLGFREQSVIWKKGLAFSSEQSKPW
ncbi:MAG TPA: hypothetical protein VKK81_14640, partial [Candidatus Binatia bacterium]|nr:hypothetical protein [Candidatus Binatia bacterium]